ncbi:MAG: complex I NDUFA9 subunit family protein [Clostridiales bacterium]|nr:complex I NDUFA9 subunit family protein [Clostridiales bacterium]MCF8022300.1 complex I NDUFA9 subunit family protein [Clostridiales bacterium]
MILVTGGTGFIGRHLVWELIRQGYQVRVLVRDLLKGKYGFPDEVEPVKGDITDRSSIAKACEGVDTVIHLVAVIRETENITFEKLNVEGTLNLVIAAEETGVKRFIHLSVLGANDKPAYRYIYSKWLGEKSVCESNLDWTVLRPSIVYGEGFCFFDRMLQALKLFPPPFFPIPGNGKSLFQPVAVEDVVSCILIAVKSPEMYGKVYEVGGPEHLNYIQMVNELFNVLNVKRLKIRIPISLMNTAVPFLNKIFKDPPVTPVELKQLEVDNITEKDAVQQYFGFEPRPLNRGLQYLLPRGKKK